MRAHPDADLVGADPAEDRPVRDVVGLLGGDAKGA